VSVRSLPSRQIFSKEKELSGRPINESDKMANNTLENVQGMTIKAKQSTGRPGPQRLDSLVNPSKDLMFYLQDFKNHI